MDSAAKKLAAIVKRIAGDAGTVRESRMYTPEEGGGWCVILDTEYAALRVHYHYRLSNVRMGVAACGGWYVAVG